MSPSNYDFDTEVSAPSEVTNFINGFAVASRGSSHKHLLPTPIDLGDREPALCGVVPALGWTEPETVDQWFCYTCLVRLQQMYDADDQRLTPQDRQRYRELTRGLVK